MGWKAFVLTYSSWLKHAPAVGWLHRYIWSTIHTLYFSMGWQNIVVTFCKLCLYSQQRIRGENPGLANNETSIKNIYNTLNKWTNINETSIKHDQSMYIKEFMCPKSLKGAGKHQIISNLFKGAEPSRCRSHGNKQQVSLVNKLPGSVALEPSVLPNIQSHEVRNPSIQENFSKCYVWNLLWKKETNPWFLGVRFLRYPM